MIKKTKYQQLPALLQKGVAALALASCFVGCAVSDPLNTDEATGELTFSASIGDPKEIIVSRASGDEAWEKLTGTYLSFKEGTAFGVYANNGFGPDGMKNLPVTKQGSAWTTDSPVKWQDASITGGITFNAYYPQSKTPEAYSILADPATGALASGEYQLKDVLVATRTNVSYNNPALFFTFTHRFALLRIKLGNGFDGFEGKVTATMAQAVATTVDIATNGGLVELTNTEGAASTFVSPTTTGREFYVLVPADAVPAARKVTSITLGDKKIENTKNPNNMPELFTEPNTIYTLTAHVIDGAPVIRVVGIEAWTEAEYLGNGKGKPGIYTEEELVEFADAYNSSDNEERDYKLSSFGEKKDGVWTIYLQDNLYLPELDDLRTEENESEYTATLVTAFSDIFAGQGYTINGMSIVGGNGLFGTLTSSAKVNDLILTDASVTNTPKDKTLANSDPTGILAGTAEEGSIITNCHIFGTSASTGTSHTGGLVGFAAGEINRSSSFAIVSGPTSGDFFIGGLVGQAASTTTTTIIKNSFAKGWVTGTADKVGALVGNGVSSITVTNCYATVNVNGTLQSLEYTKTK